MSPRLPPPDPSLMGTVTRGADDDWDPRVDSGGRRANHPDFGKDWLDNAGFWFDAVAYLAVALALGTLAGTWATGFDLGVLGAITFYLTSVCWSMFWRRLWNWPE